LQQDGVQKSISSRNIGTIPGQVIEAQGIACRLYELRNEAGLTQAELAELVGTSRTVITRLEDDDDDGHSLSMLRRGSQARASGMVPGHQFQPRVKNPVCTMVPRLDCLPTPLVCRKPVHAAGK
jgi:DNA-binding XRE family transcriptional regulator